MSSPPMIPGAKGVVSVRQRRLLKICCLTPNSPSEVHFIIHPSSFIFSSLWSQRPRRRHLSENQRPQTKVRGRLMRFGSEANHAVSNYQTVFAAVPTVKQNQPLLPALWHRTIEDERHRNVP